MSHFKTSDLSYSIDADLQTVWDRYMVINPLKIWSNRRSRIVAAYAPSQDQTLNRDDMAQSWPGFEEGMKIFVDMSSLPWAVSNKPAIMVALKIVEIDPDAKRVVFRYLEGTPSYGEQVIQFSVSEDNPKATAISHKTWFRPYGRLIERFYPIFHRKMINSMHDHYKREIER